MRIRGCIFVVRQLVTFLQTLDYYLVPEFQELMCAAVGDKKCKIILESYKNDENRKF